MSESAVAATAVDIAAETEVVAAGKEAELAAEDAGEIVYVEYSTEAQLPLLRGLIEKGEHIYTVRVQKTHTSIHVHCMHI
jgi:hypothetical protein